MNILGLRSSLPAAGNSVLAHRLRFEVAPPRWLPFVVKALRVVVCFWVSFQFTVGLFRPFQWPFGVATTLSVVVGVTLWWALNLGCARFDPRVQALLSRWVNSAPPLQSLFRDWNDLTARLAASAYAVRHAGGVSRERDHLFLGTVHGSYWPFLFDISRPRHVLLTGATSSGKAVRLPDLRFQTQGASTLTARSHQRCFGSD